MDALARCEKLRESRQRRSEEAAGQRYTRIRALTARLLSAGAAMQAVHSLASTTLAYSRTQGAGLRINVS